jgi:Phage stabilisation protein
MNLKPIPLFGIGNQGKSPNVDAQTRTNLYIEVQQDAEKHVLTIYPTPGLSTFVNFGANPARGMYEKGNLIFYVNRNKLYTIQPDGVRATIGTLDTSDGKVFFADNGIQVMLTDGPNGYIYNTNTLVFSKITSLGFPGASSLTFINGVFVVSKPNTGQFYTSKSYDGLTWDALEFATAEADPDNIVRLISEAGQLVIFGDKTTEFWGDSGALDFRFARIGSSSIEWGLAARDSLTKFMDSLIFLRKNRLGQVQVAVLVGNNAIPVSTPEIDNNFSKYSVFSDATGFAYMLSGHPFYQITFPSANVSWLYDGQSKSWTKLESQGGRHRADQHIQLLSKNYVSDYENGKLYRLDENIYTDDGLSIVREFTSRHQANGNFTHASQLWLELEAGAGLQFGQGQFPQVMMQISKDGGHTWGTEMWREFGAVGKYIARAVWNRLGRSRDWVYKFRITDPVRTVIIAAWGR